MFPTYKGSFEILSHKEVRLTQIWLPMYIHVILAWNEIGRSAIFGREIGVPDREVFSRRKKSILVAKIVISSTVDHCKMFYLPVYGMLNNTVHCSAPFW